MTPVAAVAEALRRDAAHLFGLTADAGMTDEGDFATYRVRLRETTGRRKILADLSLCAVSWISVVQRDGSFDRQDVKARPRPWTLRAPGTATATFDRFDRAWAAVLIVLARRQT